MLNCRLEYLPLKETALSNTTPRYRLLEQFAAVAKALSHPNRLELLELLAQSERSVDSLAQVAGLSIANTSQHLQYMRRAGLVASRKDGQRVFYRLAGNDVIDLLRALQQSTERHLGEVDRIVTGYFSARDSLEPISREELMARINAGTVTVLDVRPDEEYDAGHIEGALNMPLDELKKRLKEFPKTREIIAYCRGSYCVLSFEAVAMLRELGYKVRRLEEGYPEWKAAGLPVEGAAPLH